MHTTCPNCQTLFNVTTEQLRAARGMVRCGHCLDTFDALVELSDGGVEEIVPTPEPHATIESHGDRELLRSPGGGSDWILTEVEGRSDEGVSLSRFESERSPPTGPIFQSRNLDDVTDGPVHSDADLDAAARLAATESPEYFTDFEGVIPGTLGNEPDAKEAASSALGEEIGVFDTPDDPQKPTEHYGSQPSSELFGETHDYPHVLEEDLNRLAAAGTRTRMRYVFLGLSLIALLMLAVQYLWFMPEDALRRYPMSAPLVQQVCARSDCDLLAQREPQSIVLVSRDVRVHPRYEGALMVSAALENGAEFTQPYPHVQFTLFNVNGQTIAARIFEPGEYLPASTNISAGMTPHQSTQIELNVLAPDEAAISFEFKFL